MQETGVRSGLERPPGEGNEGNGSSLQYSCLENSRTEEPGGLQSMWATKSHDLAANTFNCKLIKTKKLNDGVILLTTDSIWIVTSFSTNAL